MKSLKTRMATGALAGAMALSLAVPAFAADPATKLTATYAEVPIDVTVPTTGTATLNPLGMPVTLVAGTTKTDPVISSSQIANVPLYLQNNMSMKLAVKASVSTVSKFALAEEAWEDGEDAPDTKTAYVYLGVKTAEEAVGDGDAAINTLSDKGVVNATAVAMQAAAIEFNAEAVNNTDGSAVVILESDGSTKAFTSTTDDDETTKKKASMAVLNAKSTKGDDGAVTYNPDSIGIFGLYGKMVEDPQKTGTGGATVSDPWLKTDTITATIAWQFSVVKEA